MEWRAFKENGLQALIASIKEAAGRSMSAVSDLGKDLVGLAEQTNAALAGKQDKRSAAAITLPASGWQSDNTAGYPYYYDLPVAGVTARDRAEVIVTVSGLAAAQDCGLCPANETLAGKIRLRAKTVPAAGIAAEYWIEKGKG